MGTYLATGIVQDIIVYKRYIRYQDITGCNIAKGLSEKLNIDCYNYSEDDKAYYWKIKPEMLETNLAEFLDAQFEIYDNKKNSHMQNAVEELAKIKGGEGIMKLAADRSLVNFKLIDYIMEDIKLTRGNGFDEYVEAHYNLMAYFMNGKIIMECYGKILRYFEHNIRLQKTKYPIVDCVKVMITS